MNIWTPKFKIQEPNREIVLRSPLSGRFKLFARGPLGNVRRESPWFDNLILDAGLDRVGESNVTHTTCAVGTGTGTPANSDTALGTLVASTASIESSVNATSASSPYFARKTWTYRFAQGDAEGNLAEVGVGWGATTLFSRALIEDEEGDPTTFTVLADEFLDVAYQLTCNVPLVDVEDSIDISGASHDIVMRAANANQAGDNGWSLNSLAGSGSFSGGAYSAAAANVVYDGVIGAITAVPSGTQSNADGIANATYSAGTFRRDYTATFGLNVGNVGGISAARTRMGGGSGSSQAAMNFQVSFDPVIDKDATKILTLTFRHAWARGS